jgi:hypothetical protein
LLVRKLWRKHMPKPLAPGAHLRLHKPLLLLPLR